MEEILCDLPQSQVCLLLAAGKGLWSLGSFPAPLQIWRQSLSGEQVLPGYVCSYPLCYQAASDVGALAQL